MASQIRARTTVDDYGNEVTVDDGTSSSASGQPGEPAATVAPAGEDRTLRRVEVWGGMLLGFAAVVVGIIALFGGDGGEAKHQDDAEFVDWILDRARGAPEGPGPWQFVLTPEGGANQYVRTGVGPQDENIGKIPMRDTVWAECYVTNEFDPYGYGYWIRIRWPNVDPSREADFFHSQRSSRHRGWTSVGAELPYDPGDPNPLGVLPKLHNGDIPRCDDGP